jgi:hypothetical protein
MVAEVVSLDMRGEAVAPRGVLGKDLEEAEEPADGQMVAY